MGVAATAGVRHIAAIYWRHDSIKNVLYVEHDGKV